MAAAIIYGLTVLLWPFVILSNYISKWISPGKEGPSTSREELAAMTSLGLNEGVFDTQDAKTLQSVIEFQSASIRDVFTPRQRVQFVSETQTIEELLETLKISLHSRLPVLGENEKVLGFVLRGDLLSAAAADEFGKTVNDFIRRIHIVPLEASLKNALIHFLKNRDQIAAVVDEYGNFAGVLSMEDVLEKLTGLQIVDELDEVESDRSARRHSVSVVNTFASSGPRFRSNVVVWNPR